MPRINDDKTLARICVRVWADDYEYLRKATSTQGALGLNLTIRQIIHTYVAGIRDKEQQELNKLLDDIDSLDIKIDLSNLEFETAEPTAEPADLEPDGVPVDITL